MPNKRYILFLFILSSLALPSISNAQKTDSIPATKKQTKPFLLVFRRKVSDSLVIRKKRPYPDPRKATLYSAILPGAGQFYCKAYWRIPIIYAGLGVVTYFIITNQQEYNTFNSAYIQSVTPGSNYNGIYTSADLLNIKNYYQRNFQLSIIGAAFIYLLNIIDADVDAQLHSFDVSDDISLHFTPKLTPNPWAGNFAFQPGFTLVKKF